MFGKLAQSQSGLKCGARGMLGGFDYENIAQHSAPQILGAISTAMPILSAASQPLAA